MTDDDHSVDESAAALRAKAAHCMSVAAIMETEETRQRLLQMASDYLARATQLERNEKK